MKTLKELDLDRKSAEQFIIKNLCGDCGAGLGVAWGGSFGVKEYIIRCGSNIEHSNFGKRKDNKELMEEMMANEQHGPQVSDRKLAKVPVAIQPLMTKLALTQPEVITVLKTLWNDAPDIEIKKAAAYCAMYRLNPLKKHVILMKFWNSKEERFDWAMAEGIDGTRLQVARKHKYSYLDGPRVMKEQEQIETFGEYKPNDVITIVKIKDVDSGAVAPGYGSWPKEKTYYNKKQGKTITERNTPHGEDKGNSMFNMSSIHGERQAFRRLYPADVPDDSPVFDERFEDLPEAGQNGHVVEGEIVNQDTGEMKRVPVGEGELTSPFTDDDNPAAPKEAQKVEEGMIKKDADVPPLSVDELIARSKEVGVSEKDLLEQIGAKNRDGIKNLPAAWRTAVAFGEFLKNKK